MHEMIFLKPITLELPDLTIKGVKGEWNCLSRSDFYPSIDADEEEDYNTCTFEIGDDELVIAISDRIVLGNCDVCVFINDYLCDRDMHWLVSVKNIAEDIQKVAKKIEKMWDKLLL